MAKDFATGGDVSSDVGSNTDSVARSDFGGDLANDNGVDLNANDVAKADGGRRGLAAGLAGVGVVTSPFAPLADQPIDTNNPDSILGPRTEIHAPAPERPQQTFEQQYPGWAISDGTIEESPLPTPLEEAAEIGATIEQGGTVDEIEMVDDVGESDEN